MFSAETFSRCVSRPISMGLWTHFARGSNFLNWTLFGSGHAGLGLVPAPMVVELVAPSITVTLLLNSLTT
jgi:hypothetical protein